MEFIIFIVVIYCTLFIVVNMYSVCLPRLSLYCYKTIELERISKRTCKNNECAYYNQILPVLPWSQNTNRKINTSYNGF